VAATACAAVVGLGLMSAVALAAHAAGLRRRSGNELRLAAASLGALFVLGGCLGYGSWYEADSLSETRIEVPTPGLKRGERLRLVQLSDLHVDGPTRALAELPGRVNALHPDLLVFTGDSINSVEGLPELHRVLSAIQTRFGRYAVKGNHDVWYWPDQDLFGNGVATELTGEAQVVADGRVTLCGAPYGQWAWMVRCLTDHPSGVRVAVYHTPDVVEELAPLGPDLYLAGHTHGGQVRVPGYGAIATASRFGKRFEMGRYLVGRTTLFVSRGIGFEPAPAPRVRFLCPPEIAVIDLVGTG
jgi:predicted MPP superfamily phosphohydrolase